MANGEERRLRTSTRWILWLTAPLWAAPFLLVQAIRLCADGLLATLEELFHRPFKAPGIAR
jgi:hypothetical protein